MTAKEAGEISSDPQNGDVFIVIPMAGYGSRFLAQGYQTPKFKLEYSGRSLFRHSVDSFSSLFNRAHFIFVFRKGAGTEEFIEFELSRSGLSPSSFSLLGLENQTDGQAHSVQLGLTEFCSRSEARLIIFNVDTAMQSFELDESLLATSDGYLEVFQGEGSHWSFVRGRSPARESQGIVAEVREKKRISKLCSTGLYAFSRVDTFQELFAAYCARGFLGYEEAYVAPLYQLGLELGMIFKYKLVDKDTLRFSGTPEEFESLEQSSVS